jgi:transposase InsO family protein
MNGLMPWHQTNPMDQRTQFALEAINSENFSALCRKYGISAKTGYKWKERFLQHGLGGLAEESRRPRSHPEALDEQTVCAIVRLKERHRPWGARKLRDIYLRQHGGQGPSESSFKRVLEKAGLVDKRRVRPAPAGRICSGRRAQSPNEVWTIDFKGWWHDPQGRRCEPLTVRDEFSRYVLESCRLPEAHTQRVWERLERLFERHGLPEAIRSDNGPPFASRRGVLGLSRLSSRWVALGIGLERSRPGCPQDNGAHERMHVDVAADLQADPAASFDLQQRACDRWRQVFNNVRPHEALGGKTPDEVYQPTPGKLRARLYLYPLAWIKRVVSASCAIVVGGKAYSISHALHGHLVALEPLEGLRCRVWFHDVDLGEIEVADARAAQLQGRAS